MFNDRQKEALEAPIPRDYVGTRPQGGQQVSFITGHHAIARANEILGADGWSVELRAFTETYRGTRPGNNNTDNLVVLYRAEVRVAAGGVFKDDVGVGVCDCAVNDRNIAQTIEKAQKEAVTDGVKRCLRYFGNSLGLGMYDKSGAGVGHSTLALDLLAEVREVRDVDAWVGANRDLLNGKDLDDDERTALRAAVATRKNELASGGAPAAPPPPPPALPASNDPGPAPPAPSPAVAGVLQRLGACRTVDEVVAVVLSSGVPDAAKRTVWNAALARAVALDESVTSDALGEDVARSKQEIPDPKPWGVWAELIAAVWGARDLAAVEVAVKAHGAACSALPPALKARANGLIVTTRLRLRAERATTNAELEAIYAELRTAVEAARVTEGAAAWLTSILNTEAQRVAGKRAA